MRLHRKRCSAATAGGGVRVVDGEARADQLFCEIDSGVFQKWQRHLIDHNALSLTFEHEVIGFRRVQSDLILKAGTAAALDGDTQSLALRGGPDLGQPFKGARGHFRGQVHRGFLRWRVAACV